MQQKALILGFSLLGWVTIGFWLGIYDAPDAEPRRTILRDSVRHSIYTGLCVLAFEYTLRMDLSRFFLALYTLLTWTFIVAYELAAVIIASVSSGVGGVNERTLSSTPSFFILYSKAL
jgi:hypothetical protein